MSDKDEQVLDNVFELKEALRQRSARIKELEEELKEEKEMVLSLKRLFRCAEEVNKCSKENLDAAHKKIKELEKENHSWKMTSNYWEEKVNQKDYCYDSMLKEKNEEIKELKGDFLDGSEAYYKERIAKLENDTEKYESVLGEKNKELKQKTNCIKGLEEELNTAENKVRDMHETILQDGQRLADYIKQIEKLEEKMSVYQDQYWSHMNSALKLDDRLEEENKELKEEALANQKQIQILRECKEELYYKNNKLKTRNSNLWDANAYLKQQIEKLEEKKEVCEHEHIPEEMADVYCQNCEEAKKLKYEIEDLEEQRSANISQLKRVSEAFEYWKKRAEGLEEDLEKLKKR